MKTDIQVAPVRSLLFDAASEFEELEAVRIKLRAQKESLVETLGECAEIAAAVTRIGTEVLEADQTAIMVRCNNAVKGVDQAVDEYQRGDEEMVLNAQHAAASLPGNYQPARDWDNYRARAVQ